MSGYGLQDYKKVWKKVILFVFAILQFSLFLACLRNYAVVCGNCEVPAALPHTPSLGGGGGGI